METEYGYRIALFDKVSNVNRKEERWVKEEEARQRFSPDLSLWFFFSKIEIEKNIIRHFQCLTRITKKKKKKIIESIESFLEFSFRWPVAFLPRNLIISKSYYTMVNVIAKIFFHVFKRKKMPSKINSVSFNKKWNASLFKIGCMFLE